MTGTATPAPPQGVLPFDEWDVPLRRTAAPAASPLLRVEGFEGPLDWLLELARTRRIDLAQLSILALVEAFEAALADALDGADTAPLLLACWGDWLVMAAELTLLRSRLLGPAEAGVQAAREDAERLRQTLLRRAEAARAADWLDARPQLGRDVHPSGHAATSVGPRRPRTGDITSLLRACLAALLLPAGAAAPYRVPGPPFWSVADALMRIRTLLAVSASGSEAAARPLGAFLPPVPAAAPDREHLCRTAVAATFLASLELAREGTAVLVQDAPWHPIRLGGSGTASAGLD